MFLKLTIRANEGYDASGAASACHCLTVGELREILEGLDDDMEIVTHDMNNSRGACWGVVKDAYEIDGEDDDCDEDEDY